MTQKINQKITEDRLQTTKQIADDLRDFLLLSGESVIDLEQGESIVFVAENMLPDTIIIIAPYGGGVYHMCIVDRITGYANISAYVYNAIGIISELVKYLIKNCRVIQPDCSVLKTRKKS